MYTVIIYGTKGMGKSSYSFLTGVDVLTNGDYKKKKYDASWAWEELKDRIVFTPAEFLEKVMNLEKRVEFIIWDDAGLWLNALRWNDPFVKRVQEYLNVARTDMAVLMMTTPTSQMVVKKIRESEPAFFSVAIRYDTQRGTASLKELADGTLKDYKYREARGYFQFLKPDGELSLPKHAWTDHFSALMPDDFYKWYKPLRNKYATMAKELMKYELELKKQEMMKHGKLIPGLFDEEDIEELQQKQIDDAKLREFLEE